ncbi:MAG: type II toxin-antitoxin system VapC family toxin [Gammaproteobacteria bacterium]|nr:type II toxin-antitoxin system VapC family toxin [Gammaproteobacteria bacterium]
MKKQSIYIETSVISYLTANPSRDIIVTSHQQVTAEWWSERKSQFRVFVSQFVLEEAGGGDKLAAKRRLNILQDIPLLEFTETTLELAKQFVQSHVVPAKALVDALHISVATVHGMNYLLTWNCKHIANAEIRQALTEISKQSGYNLPIICTPEELMGKNYET